MLESVQAYPQSVLVVVAALAEIERKHGHRAATYEGLAAMVAGGKHKPKAKHAGLVQGVLKARKAGLVDHATKGGGKGHKSAFQLTAKGRTVADLPAL